LCRVHRVKRLGHLRGRGSELLKAPGADYQYDQRHLTQTTQPARVGTRSALAISGSCSEAIGADQDLALALSMARTATAAQSSSGVKQTAIAAPDAVEETVRVGGTAARTSDRAVENTQKL
jgi:hypothetical protein